VQNIDKRDTNISIDHIHRCFTIETLECFGGTKRIKIEKMIMACQCFDCIWWACDI